MDMKKSYLTSSAATLVILFGTTGYLNAQKISYPETRTVNHVDIYHGVTVHDPYRWMEEFESEEVIKWAKTQDILSQSFINKTSDKNAIKKRIEEVGHFDSYGIPVRKTGYYFFTKTEAGGNQPSVYVQKGLESNPRIIFNPAKVIEDKELRFGGFTPSPNGALITFRIAKNQSRWGSVKVMDVENGTILPDLISGMRTNSTIWTNDSEGFFYAKYGDIKALEEGTIEPFAQLYYHKLGTNQGEDILVYERVNEPTWVYGLNLSDDGRYILISQGVPGNSNNRIFYKETDNLEAPAKELVNDFEQAYTFLGNNGSLWWFQTNDGQGKGRVVGIDITKPEPEHWVEIIAEQNETLNSVSIIGDRFVASYLKDAREQLKVFDLKGKHLYDLKLPFLGGRYGGFGGDRTSNETFFNVSGSYDPGTTYRLDISTGEYTFFQRPHLNFNPDDFTTTQVFYESKDETRIPMSIAHKKGIVLDGSHPVFMYAFGSGGWSAYLWFQSHMVTWMEMGGVYVLPNIRGGGEYGTNWMNAGIKGNKQNAIDDYIAATEWLIENKYTSPSKMVANGGSSSALLPAAAIIQRPELFGASIIDIPFLDMLRYQEFTIWSGWRDAFGVSTNTTEFKVLNAYSPYHNIKPGTCYPPTLVSIGEKDKGAVPMHGYKFVAAMQAAQSCTSPALLKVIWNTGHSFGSSPEQRQGTYADQLAFLVRVLGMELSF